MRCSDPKTMTKKAAMGVLSSSTMPCRTLSAYDAQLAVQAAPKEVPRPSARISKTAARASTYDTATRRSAPGARDKARDRARLALIMDASSLGKVQAGEIMASEPFPQTGRQQQRHTYIHLHNASIYLISKSAPNLCLSRLRVSIPIPFHVRHARRMHSSN